MEPTIEETLKPMDGPVALVIKNGTRELTTGLARFFTDYAIYNKLDSGRIPLVISLAADQSIDTLDEDEMREHGWVRA